MKIKLNAYPAVYFTARCNRHHCWVELRESMSKDVTDTVKLGGSLTAMQCQVGGKARESSCVDYWELTVSGAGPVMVEG